MSELKEKVKDVASDTWSWIRKKSAQCEANTEVEDIIGYIGIAEDKINITLRGAELLKVSGSFQKLTKAKEALGDVKTTLENIQNLCRDVKALGKITDAVAVLNQIDFHSDDSEKMAWAYGQLFEGFGRLCLHLPSPIKQWGKIFESAGDFFLNMRKKLHPGLRPNWKRQSDYVLQRDGRPVMQ